MRRAHLLTWLLLGCFPGAQAAVADGGFFFVQGQTTDLAQTGQEVVLAVGSDQVTYVLRTRYAGAPSQLAWVVPVPATPTGVTAHEDDTLFDQLNDLTKPTFIVTGRAPSRFGCACGGMALQDSGTRGGLVEVEASGQAGIFDYAALTSTGGQALVTWLNNNGFAVPTQAGDILDGYIQQDMHFLAIRVNEPDQIETSGDGQIEIPPIQWTCQTTNRFYPMVISQISADDETEVLIYVFADHRAEAKNVPNAVISNSELVYDADTPSLTNYESLFAQKIAEHGGTALITEYASGYLSSSWISTNWTEAPAGVANLDFLTRMRTVMAPADMTVDFEFQDASSDESVSSDFYVTGPSDLATASLAGQPLAALVVFGLFRAVTRRRRRAGPCP